MSAVCPAGHTSESEDYCDTCGSPIDPAAVIPAGGSAVATGAGSGAVTAGGAASAGSSAGSPAKSALDLDPAAPPATTGGSPGAPAPTAPAGIACPNCQFENADGALFCEACGYDFTTGVMPRGSSTPAAGAGEAGESAGPAGPAAPAFVWVAEVWVDPDWYATQEAEDPCPSPGLPTIIPLRERSVLMGRISSSRNTDPEIDLSSDPGVSRRHAQLTTDGKRWFVEDLDSSNGTFVGPAAGPLPDKAIATGPKTEMDADDRLYVGAWTRVVVREATPEEIETYR